VRGVALGRFVPDQELSGGKAQRHGEHHAAGAFATDSDADTRGAPWRGSRRSPTRPSISTQRCSSSRGESLMQPQGFGGDLPAADVVRHRMRSSLGS